MAQTWDVSVEQLLPALMRQEVEGGILLIGALGRCMRQGECAVASEPCGLVGVQGTARRWGCACSRMTQWLTGAPGVSDGVRGRCMPQVGMQCRWLHVFRISGPAEWARRAIVCWPVYLISVHLTERDAK